MQLTEKPKKKSKLTLYILIGLFAGIILGFALNKNYVNEENTRLELLDKQLSEIKAKQHATTDNAVLTSLDAEKKNINTKRNEVLQARSEEHTSELQSQSN